MPRPDVSVERKAQIVAAAIKLFAQKGLDNTRMDEVAEEAGLSVGGVYWYFDGKDQIILAILDHFIQMDHEHLDRLLQAEGPALARLHQFLQADNELTMQVYPLIYELYSLAQRNEGLRQRVNTYLQVHRQTLKALLAQAVTLGELKPHDTDLAALTLSALSQGLFDLALFDPAGSDVPTAMRDTAKLVLASLVASPGPS